MSQDPLLSSVKCFGRMVDDIFTVISGPFDNFRKFIALLLQHYPDMALNLQYSLHYSRYLDVHLYKVLPKTDVQTFTIYSTLAWKKQNNFCYVPQPSNIHEKYKACAVPVNLHRIDKRCTDDKDRNHHRTFLHKILTHRDQDMGLVIKKTKQYVKRKRLKQPPKKKDYSLGGRTSTVVFDKLTGTHDYVTSLIKKADKNNHVRPVFVNGLPLSSLVCPI